MRILHVNPQCFVWSCVNLVVNQAFTWTERNRFLVVGFRLWYWWLGCRTRRYGVPESSVSAQDHSHKGKTGVTYHRDGDGIYQLVDSAIWHPFWIWHCQKPFTVDYYAQFDNNQLYVSSYVGTVERLYPWVVSIIISE